MLGDLDEADRAFLSTILPEGAYATEFIAVVAYVNTDGGEHFKAWSASDSKVHIITGYLELAKAKMMAADVERWRRQDEEDD